MKRTTHKQTLPGVYRFLAAAMAVLWGLPLLAFWGCTVTASTPPPKQESSSLDVVLGAAAEKHDAEKEHRKVCSCANCPGGTHCCCGTADTPKDNLVIRAICDEGTPVVAGLMTAKVVFFHQASVVSTPDPLPVPAIYVTVNSDAPTHCPAPYLLPPRLS